MNAAMICALIRIKARGPQRSAAAGVFCRTMRTSPLSRTPIIVQTVAVFDDFCHANDPYEEHDFGSFEAEGEKIFFKIDYFDRTLTHHSPDPADPSVTERVITIMLADEY
jgi:Protein of unknown function (DUF3768)